MLKMYKKLWPSELMLSLLKFIYISFHNFCRALNIPISDYTFEDCKLMESALRCKLLFAEKLADVARLREKIG